MHICIGPAVEELAGGLGGQRQRRTQRGSHSQPDSCNFSPTSRPEVLSNDVSRLDQLEKHDWSNSPALSALSLRIFQIVADPIIGKSNAISHTIHPPFRNSKCVSTFRRRNKRFATNGLFKDVLFENVQLLKN